METKDQKILDEILKSHSYDQTAVIGIMQEIQKVYRYLPEEMLCYIAKKLHLSEAKVYGVATFYENFWSLRENTLSKSVTAQPVMCVSPQRF